jgi:PAS domain-containing protein
MLLKYKEADGDTITMHNDHDLKRIWRKNRRDSYIKLHLSPGTNFMTENETKALENMVDAVIIIDTKGVVLFFNRSAEILFGYERNSVLQHNVKRLMQTEDALNHNKYLKKYLKVCIF